MATEQNITGVTNTAGKSALVGNYCRLDVDGMVNGFAQKTCSAPVPALSSCQAEQSHGTRINVRTFWCQKKALFEDITRISPNPSASEDMIEREIVWDAGPLRIRLDIGADNVVRLHTILPSNGSNEPSASQFFADASLPLTEVRFAGAGNEAFKTSKTLVGSYSSTGLVYSSHSFTTLPDAQRMEIFSTNSEAHIAVKTNLTVYSDIPVLRSETTVQNDSGEELLVSQASSLVVGNLTRASRDWSRNYTIASASSSWFREAQWRDQSLANVGLGDVGLFELDDGHRAAYTVHSISSRGGFSTGTHLPMGLLKRNDQKETWLWQVEHNGSWKWELGDYQDSLYLAAVGPTGLDHDCWVKIAPGESFCTPPAAICHVMDGMDSAFAAMTRYRRRIRRPHEDLDKLPVIFNDFMNCLMGNPDEEKITALLDPAAKAGAEYYVIDAGWYADETSWWNTIGEWSPSSRRFPSGFANLIDRITSRGLHPGLWLEPEAVGIQSPISQTLPDDAFFQCHGQRVVERSRYHLDFSHPAVTDRMNHVIDSLVSSYGIQYFKFDYNIEPVLGTNVHGQTFGAGHLAHCRAYLKWLEGLLDRHPGLVIENCASGGQRMDYAMLSVVPLQSTSDQQDPLRYAAIAAAMPTAVAPEQSASWAYPQPEWSDELNALTVVNSLLGRVHLSGPLHRLSAAQLRLISEGTRV